MKKKDLQEAIVEAERFIKKAKRLQSEQASDIDSFYGSRLSGAVGRAGLDLTMALAQLRDPWRRRRA